MSPIRPTVCAGLGDFGVDLVFRWINSIRYRMPDAMPFLTPIGFCSADKKSEISRIPQQRFESAGHEKPSTRVVPWLSGMNQSNYELLNKVSAAFDRLETQSPPPATWRFQPRQATRTIVTAKLHDSSVQNFLCPSGGAEHSLMAGLWKSLYLNRNFAVRQRELWFILFIDPDPQNQESTISVIAALKEIENACQFLGDNRQGFNVLLVSSHSATAGDQQSQVSLLWSGNQSKWDPEYRKWALCYGTSVLDVLLFTGVMDEDQWWNRVTDYNNGIFSTIDFLRCDACLYEAQRAVVAGRIESEIATKLNGQSDNSQSELLTGYTEWCKEISAFPEEQNREEQYPDVITEKATGFEEGSTREALNTLRKIQRSHLADIWNYAEREAKKFAKKFQIKKELDEKLRKHSHDADQKGAEDIPHAIDAGGAEKVVKNLVYAKKILGDEQADLRVGIKWPPERVEFDKKFEKLQKKIDFVEEKSLINKKALTIHGVLSTALWGLGVFMLAFTLWPEAYGTLWLMVILSALTMPPVLWIFVFLLIWRWQKKKLVEELNKTHQEMCAKINETGKDCLKQIVAAHYKIYRFKMKKHAKRLISQYLKKIEKEKKFLDEQEQIAIKEKKDCRDFEPAGLPWCPVFFDKDLYHEMSHAGLDDLSEQWNYRLGVLARDQDIEESLRVFEDSLIGRQEMGLPEGFGEWLTRVQENRYGLDSYEKPALPLKSRASQNRMFCICHPEVQTRLKEKYNDPNMQTLEPSVIRSVPWPKDLIIAGQFWLQISADEINEKVFG